MLFTYDAVGNLSTKTDPLGNATTFTYDAVNRLSKKEYEDDSYVAYQYDANGNMTEALDGTITFEFTYDAENKVTKVRDDTQGLEIEYAYDDNGNLLWIEDTSNSKINYYYDALNRVTDITNGSTFATIEYATCCSIRTKLTLGNGAHGTRIASFVGGWTRSARTFRARLSRRRKLWERRLSTPPARGAIRPIRL